MEKAEAVVLFAMQLTLLVVAIRTAKDTVERLGFLFFQIFCFVVSVLLAAVVFGAFGPRPSIQHWMILPMVAGFGSVLLSIKPPKREVVRAPARAVVQLPEQEPQQERVPVTTESAD